MHRTVGAVIHGAHFDIPLVDEDPLHEGVFE
jgi:hypothetical protein